MLFAPPLAGKKELLLEEARRSEAAPPMASSQSVSLSAPSAAGTDRSGRQLRCCPALRLWRGGGSSSSRLQLPPLPPALLHLLAKQRHRCASSLRAPLADRAGPLLAVLVRHECAHDLSAAGRLPSCTRLRAALEWALRPLSVANVSVVRRQRGDSLAEAE